MPIADNFYGIVGLYVPDTENIMYYHGVLFLCRIELPNVLYVQSIIALHLVLMFSCGV